MDPTLRRLVEAGDGEDEVAVMVRMVGGTSPLPKEARVVSRFGGIATVRVPRRAVEDLRGASDVQSVKAPRLYRPEVVGVDFETVEVSGVDRRRPEGPAPTGRGVLIGVIDWGLDFRHPAFLRPDGNTRLVALWDQMVDFDASRSNRFGYGRIHDRVAINAALADRDPVAALGYDPTARDVGGGTHGTATTSIAAGSNWRGGVAGVAPDADIAFVNLAGTGGLGHSVALGEAVDFIREAAGPRPWVINISLGRHGGPHDGSTLLEQLLDAAITESPGGMIVNSGGNYFSSDVHTTARLRTGEVLHVPLRVYEPMGDVHEIDVWYRGIDRLMIGLLAPDGQSSAVARPESDVTLTVDGHRVARIQHRTHDPNNGRNQAVVRIEPNAGPGTWHLILVGAEVVDGRFHAWIEREALRPPSQARFERDDAVTTTTTGTICNGLRNVAVGAYDHHDPTRPPTRFSSSGDTVDGRRKPDLLAPGEGVLVARSQPSAATNGEVSLSTRMSGSSMAAPFVTGTIACMMELTGRVPAARLRAALLQAAEAFEGEESVRAGSGYLDIRAATEAVGAGATGGRSYAVRRGGARAGALSGRPTEVAPMPERVPDAAVPDAARIREPALVALAEDTAERTEPVRTTVYEIPAPSVPTDPNALPRSDELLRSLGISARGLFEVYVLGRREAERDRLASRVELVTGPGDRAGPLRAEDLLVRGVMGEGLATVSVLVSGELYDLREALAEDLQPERNLPGRYAWVIEGGLRPRASEDRFARRITDRQGYLPHDQALLRLRVAADAAVPASSRPITQKPLLASAEWRPEAVNRRSRSYVRWYQEALNRIDSAGLAVDGISGLLTEEAVRRYQARKGLIVDGIVGPNTERALVLDGAARPPRFLGLPPKTWSFTLLLDGDRDGSVEGAVGSSDTWLFGARGKGAVLLVNNDDDGINGAPDNEDAAVDSGDDKSELSPLRVEPPGSGTVPAGTRLDLIVDRPDCIRVFSSRTATGVEIIGPTAGASHRFASLPTSSLDLGMEAVRYAGRGFGGEIEIALRTTHPSGARNDQVARVRVAPWMMASNLDRVEAVFVVADPSFNTRFIRDLRPLVAAAGSRLVEFTQLSDRWMQDCMEFGFACIPNLALSTVLRAPRDRPLKTFPRSLLGTNLGYVEQGSLLTYTTFDSTGNLEASPPVTSASGRRYPFGRIYYGPGRGIFEAIDDGLEDFLRRQVVQDPIRLETGWLTVGHVDEVLSFVPASDGQGFRMLIASPRRAYAILDAVNATNSRDTILSGRMLPTATGAAVSLEQTIGAFLGLRDDFHPDLRAGIAAGTTRHTPKSLRDYNMDRQVDIDGMRRTMMTELGLADADIIEIPAVFMPNPDFPEGADALIAGMVNMLVVNGHCIVPKPFGPQVGGPPVDRFEEDVRSQLSRLGLTVRFLDCWDEYHILQGEVHCATNALRRAAPVRWWEFQP